MKFCLQASSEPGGEEEEEDEDINARMVARARNQATVARTRNQARPKLPDEPYKLMVKIDREDVGEFFIFNKTTGEELIEMIKEKTGKTFEEGYFMVTNRGKPVCQPACNFAYLFPEEDLASGKAFLRVVDHSSEEWKEKRRKIKW